MPRRISAEEAKKLGAVPMDDSRQLRKMSAEDAQKLGAVPADPPNRTTQVADAIKAKRQQMSDGLRKTGIGLSSEDQQSLVDLPGQARSAAMGFAANMADAPESLYRTIFEPGQNPGWHTEHPEVKEKYMADVEKHPVANIAGSMLQPTPFGKAKAATVAGKLALAAARVGYAGGEGALAKHMGQTGPVALAGVMDGAALPAGLQAGAELASPLLGKASKGLRALAGSQAANAAGLRGGIVNQAKRAGVPVLDKAGEEAIPAMGNKMLDAGLIPFAGSKVAVQRRAEKMMGQAGNAQEAIITQADMAGKFDQAEGVRSAAERLAKRVDPTKGGNLQTARAGAKAGEFISDASNSPGTFKAANDLKKGAYGNTNWSLEAPDAAKLKRETVSGYRQSIEDQIDALLPGQGKALSQVNSRYGLAAQTADFAEEAAGREAANQKFGWGSLMLGATGASAGAQVSPLAGGLAGVGLPAAAHFAKTRGAATMAPISRLGSKTANAAQAVNQSPAASGAAGNMLADYLKPKPDEEREEEGAAHFAKSTGGGY